MGHQTTVCMRVCMKTTFNSSYLPSYGGAGLVRPLGRGMIQYNNGASAASEVSVGSSSLSYGVSSRTTGFDGGSTLPVGRGLPVGLGRSQLLTQGPGIGNDVVCCSF